MSDFYTNKDKTNESKQPATRRHLVAKAALAFPKKLDDNGNLVGLGEPTYILDTDKLIDLLYDSEFTKNNIIVRVDTANFYK